MAIEFRYIKTSALEAELVASTSAALSAASLANIAASSAALSSASALNSSAIAQAALPISPTFSAIGTSNKPRFIIVQADETRGNGMELYFTNGIILKHIPSENI